MPRLSVRLLLPAAALGLIGLGLAGALLLPGIRERLRERMPAGDHPQTAGGGLSRLAPSERTVENVAAELGPVRRPALAAAFAAAGGCPYPPARATLLAVKDEKRLELWASDAAGRMRLVKSYPVLAASGRLGPKLREGDRQVPEGVYRVPALNPRSRFHLSIRLDYPNEFELAQARRDGRSEPGSDIFIHGGAASIGCLAMGDEAVEELFLLAHETGLKNLTVIIVPADFRRREFPPPQGAPAWTAELYAGLRRAVAELRE